MRFGFVRVMGIVALLFIFQAGWAQVPGPYHKLAAEEFAGMTEVNNGDIIAYTNCFIDFNYRATSQKGIYHLTCDIHLIFNKDKSWINRKKVLSPTHLQGILDHEQGHYTIAYMEQQELIRTVSQTRFDANYQYEAANMFDRVHEKYKQLSLDYDDDTDHMRNQKQQLSWDAWFKKRLEYMPNMELAKR